MNELIRRVKEYMVKLDNRKFINQLFILLLGTIILLILINGLSSKNKGRNTTKLYDEATSLKNENIIDYSTFLENKLKDILERLKDVGDVDIMITLEDSHEKIPAKNINKFSETTTETDSEGGTRKTTREEENTQLLQLGEDIVVLKENKANIKGVIVVAKGAENIEVLEQIYEAVKTVLGVSGNRIQVFPRK